MSVGRSRGELAEVLGELHERLVATSVPLQVAGATETSRLREEMIGQLADYVLPRLAHLDAPLVAVVGGSTGTGKSTLVNSLVGRQVSAPGVLRPTTRAAVVAHHPDDADWFSGERILPGFTRTTSGNAEPGTLRLVADSALPAGLALVDTPDVDSVVTGNRELAGQLLCAADLWLFVTSGIRYADAVPWTYLRTAAERSVAVAVVLDRVRPEQADEARRHLAQMLADRGLGEAPLFVVPETTLTKQGLLPEAEVKPVKAWCARLAGDLNVRAAVVQQTLDGVVGSFAGRVSAYADALDTQLTTTERLRSHVRRCYDEGVAGVDRVGRDGSVLRGEVLARWQEFVGTGEIVDSLETTIDRNRDGPLAGGAGEREGKSSGPGANLARSLASGFHAVVVDAADHAAEAVEAAWRQDPAGQVLLAGRSEWGRASQELPESARSAFQAWEKRLSALITDQGAQAGSTPGGRRGRKHANASLLSFGPGGLSLVLIIAVFTAEDAVEETSAVARRVLDAVFGAKVVARLIATAREDLRGRVRALLEAERARFETLLDSFGYGAEDVLGLREAARAVEAIR